MTTQESHHDERTLRRGRSALLIAIAGTILWIPIVGFSLIGPDRIDALVAHTEVMQGELRAPGRLTADGVVHVAAEAPGRIDQVMVEEGETVEAGAVLVRFDARDAADALEAARASMAAAEQAAVSARHELRSARLRGDELAADHERIAPLAGTAIPAADVEATRAAAERAEVEIRRAEARVDQADAQVELARSDVETAGRRLADLEMGAPTGGVVLWRGAAPGDVVSAGSTLMRIADPASLRITATFDESVMSQLRPGLAAGVSFYSEPGVEYPGRVERIGREVDADTREVEVVILLDQAPLHWALGQRVDARIATDPGDPATTIPSDLVTWRQGGPGVFIVAEGRARWTPVVLGRSRTAVMVEIDHGIADGDILLSPEGVREGRRVIPHLDGVGTASGGRP